MTNERKEIMKIDDLREILGGVSYTTASRKMREVKSISNILNLKGMIHRLDWEAYLKREGERK